MLYKFLLWNKTYFVNLIVTMFNIGCTLYNRFSISSFWTNSSSNSTFKFLRALILYFEYQLFSWRINNNNNNKKKRNWGVTRSHYLFLYVYDLNDSDLGLQSTIFLLNFLLLENDSVIHCNFRVFLLILVFFFFLFFFFPCQHASTWLGLSEIFSFHAFNCWEICWNWKEI